MVDSGEARGGSLNGIYHPAVATALLAWPVWVDARAGIAGGIRPATPDFRVGLWATSKVRS